MQKLIAKVWPALCLCCAMSACSSHTMYEWGSYNSSLLGYYKSQGELEAFAEKLSESIAKAEQKDRVPPGLYAEYAYVELELGDADKALEFFAKERERWPESAFLMDKVIQRIQGAPDPAAQQALEETATVE